MVAAARWGSRSQLLRVHAWFLCAGPAAVTNLTLTSANSSSLSFSWRRSDGHVDVYDVSLYSVPETAAQGVGAAASRGRHQVGVSFHCVRASNLRLHVTGVSAGCRRAGGRAEDPCGRRRLRVQRPASRTSVPPAGGELEPRHEQRLLHARQNRSVHVRSAAPWWPNAQTVSAEGVGTFCGSAPSPQTDSRWSHDPWIQACLLLGNVAFLLLPSAVCRVLSGGGQFRTDGQTDGQLAPWRRQLERLSGVARSAVSSRS